MQGAYPRVPAFHLSPRMLYLWRKIRYEQRYDSRMHQVTFREGREKMSLSGRREGD